MKFRPCIDIHNGKVKQIVGGSLQDAGDQASENFVSEVDSAAYAALYRKMGLTGGHVIMLNGQDSPYYQKTRQEALKALSAWPGGLQAGGGITAENAAQFLDAGASHVIVTSYVFRNGVIDYDRLKALSKAVGKKRLVLDISCRKRNGQYYVVTDRWQKYTDTPVTEMLLKELSIYCDEFLVHGVDVEGKASGVEKELIALLTSSKEEYIITYAGGIAGFEDLEIIKNLGKGRLDYTIGSALSIFGGTMDFERAVRWK